MRDLEQLHLARGFLTIGYIFVLFRSGRLYEGRGPRALPAAQSGHNSGTIAIQRRCEAFWRAAYSGSAQR
jgi:hypothetical protein